MDEPTTTGGIGLTVVAWNRRQKSSALFDLDVEIDVFRGFIRNAHRMGYINTSSLDPAY